MNSSAAKRIGIIQFYFHPDISAVSQMLEDLLEEVSGGNRWEITEIHDHRARSCSITRVLYTGLARRPANDRLMA